MKKIFSILIICLIATVYSTPFFALAQTVTPAGPQANCDLFDSRSTCYQQLAPITDPGTGLSTNTTDFPTYLQAMYRIGIGACFVLGVIMFTWAGIEYIVSESMNTKKDAQSRLQNALIGLAIALVSYILLYTINPDLLQFKSLNTSVTPTYTPATPAGPNQ